MQFTMDISTMRKYKILPRVATGNEEKKNVNVVKTLENTHTPQRSMLGLLGL
jgi:hypothetical protein